MSADPASGRLRPRTAIAALAIVGFVLLAAVLPAVGSSAPGAALLPGNLTDGNGSAASQPRGNASGDSLVGGLLGRLPRRPDLGSGPGGPEVPGGRESGFGALDPGSRTGVGSSQSPVSQSLRNQSAQPHLVVRSSEPSYWRTGAYDSYTGDGWTTQPRPDRESLPLRPETAAADRRRVVQRYRLLESASSLPVAWEPRRVEGLPADRLRVDPNRGITARPSLPANTTYTAVSAAPPRDVSRLRTAGRDYPTAVEERFTALPDSVPDRVAEKTADITADAETPYGTAVAIERWLERNKEYSLAASHDGGDVTDQFVFEMDRGYCEYFATSMVVMLRSQGVPARYAVGYSTGQPRGNGTYLVRAMNAHAWVEVYFPETGWVRFDPTPGRSRLASEFRAYEQAIENRDPDAVAEQFLQSAARDGSARPPGGSAGGSPGGSGGLPNDAPTPTPGDADLNTSTGERTADRSDGGTRTTQAPGGDGANETTVDEETFEDLLDSYNHTESGSPGESFDAGSNESYRVSLSPDPVPGQRVRIRVERGGDPAPDLAVTVNGERVGTTNATGEVTATVPFASRLVVNVSTPEGAGSTALGAPVGVDAAAATAAQTGPNGTSRTFTVPTDIALAVDGRLGPGEAVTVTATIDGTPVPDAAVAVGGEDAGRTNATGRRRVTLPVNETTTVTVSRGEATGSARLRLADVTVSTSGFALPGLSVTATVTDRGDPVEGATVSVGGATATTGPDGRATLGLPVALGATVTAETPAGLSAATDVRYRYLTAVGLLLVVGALLGGAVLLWRRANWSGRSLREQLAATLRWLSGAVVTALVGFAVAGERLLARLPALGARARTAVRSLVAAVRAQELPGPPDLRAVLARARAWLAAVAAGLRSPLPGRTGGGSRRDATDSVDGTAEAVPDARERVRSAWRQFRGRVPVGDHRTKTPGELSRRAEEAGFPRSAVRTLRDAVRSVEYARRDPEAFVDPVTDALDNLDAGDPGDDADGEDADDGDTPVADGGERA